MPIDLSTFGAGGENRRDAPFIVRIERLAEVSNLGGNAEVQYIFRPKRVKINPFGMGDFFMWRRERVEVVAILMPCFGLTECPALPQHIRLSIP